MTLMIIELKYLAIQLRLNNNTLWGMDLSDDFKRNIDINFSQANGHSHQVDFLIYPLGILLVQQSCQINPYTRAFMGALKLL